MLIAGILLAAGQGKRFDASGQHNKLLTPLADGEPLAIHSARNLLAVLPQVVAVVPPGVPRLGTALAALGCHVCVCEDASNGMATSLVRGVCEAEIWQPDGWLVALADMPWVLPASIRTLLAAATRHAASDSHPVPDSPAIFAPYYQGKRGNPVLFLRQHGPDLLALQGDQGARTLLQTQPVIRVDLADSGILRDVDTPADLAHAGAGVQAAF